MSKDAKEGMLSMDMECLPSPLILYGVAGGERNDSCSSVSVAPLVDWVHGTVYLAWMKLQAEAPSISSWNRSLFGPGYASEEMWHHPCLSHASHLYHHGISWKRCCQSLCTWPHLSSWEELSPWESSGDGTSCHPWSWEGGRRELPGVLPLDSGSLHLIQRCSGRVHPWMLHWMSGQCGTPVADASGHCNSSAGASQAQCCQRAGYPQECPGRFCPQGRSPPPLPWGRAPP